MKANEFVRLYGINEAKDFVDKVIDHLSMGDDFKVDELKHLIESHELIKELGGLNCVKFKLGLYDSVSVISRLKQAIADVESCQ